MCVGCALDRALINYGLHNVDILWMPEGDLRLQKVRFKTAQASLYPTPRPYTQYPHRASDHQRWIRVESALNPIARMGGRVGGGRVAGRTGGGRAGGRGIGCPAGGGRADGWPAGWPPLAIPRQLFLMFSQKHWLA